MSQNQIFKFRAWDKAQTKMLSHEEIDQLDKDGVAHLMDIIQPDNKDQIQVMLSTGLVCGKSEVYRGDLVQIRDWGNEGRIIGISEIFWDQDECGYRARPNHGVDDFYDMKRAIACGKIIGNIYENPELIP